MAQIYDHDDPYVDPALALLWYQTLRSFSTEVDALRDDISSGWNALMDRCKRIEEAQAVCRPDDAVRFRRVPQMDVIWKLPPNLLAMIFQLGRRQEEDESHSFAIASVCRRWRNLAISLPALWSKFTINWTNMDVSEDHFEKQRAYLNMMLDRSGSHPLSFSLVFPDYNVEAWRFLRIRPLFDLLTAHLKRWKMVKIDFGDLPFFGLPVGTAPILESLHLCRARAEYSQTDNYQAVYSDEPPLVMPRLKRLRLTSSIGPVLDHIRCDKATIVELDCVKLFISKPMSAVCPAVEDLTFAGEHLPYPDPLHLYLPDGQRAPLERLTRLTIKGFRANWLEHYVSFPNLTSLVTSVYDCDMLMDVVLNCPQLSSLSLDLQPGDYAFPTSLSTKDCSHLRDALTVAESLTNLSLGSSSEYCRIIEGLVSMLMERRPGGFWTCPGLVNIALSYPSVNPKDVLKLITLRGTTEAPHRARLRTVRVAFTDNAGFSVSTLAFMQANLNCGGRADGKILAQHLPYRIEWSTFEDYVGEVVRRLCLIDY